MCDSILDYVASSYDVVVIVKNVFLEKTFQENKTILQEALSGVITGVTK